jgi:hypothetical protein
MIFDGEIGGLWLGVSVRDKGSDFTVLSENRRRVMNGGGMEIEPDGHMTITVYSPVDCLGEKYFTFQLA